MRLGYFTMPVHPMHRNWTETLKEDREAIIHWLSTTDPSVNFHASCRKCQPETGQWLINRPDFKYWRGVSNSFLWLYGIRELSLSYHYNES